MCHILHAIFSLEGAFIEFSPPQKCKNFQRPETQHRNWNNFFLQLRCQKYKSISLKKRAAQHEKRLSLMHFTVFCCWVICFSFEIRQSRFHYAGDIKNICCLFALKFWQQTIQFKRFSVFFLIRQVVGLKNQSIYSLFIADDFNMKHGFL